MRDSREQGTENILRSCNGLYFASLQGREDKPSVLPPCFTPSSRKGASSEDADPSSSITAGLCRRSLAYYYKVSSVRSSKTMFGSALRVPLSPPGTRFDVLHCVLFSSQLLTDVLRKTAFSCTQCYFTILEKVCQICLRCSMPGTALKKVLTTAAQRSNIKTY